MAKTTKTTTKTPNNTDKTVPMGSDVNPSITEVNQATTTDKETIVNTDKVDDENTDVIKGENTFDDTNPVDDASITKEQAVTVSTDKVDGLYRHDVTEDENIKKDIKKCVEPDSFYTNLQGEEINFANMREVEKLVTVCTIDFDQVTINEIIKNEFDEHKLVSDQISSLVRDIVKYKSFYMKHNLM